ncbi:hypothetical protein KSF78_0008425 [Schistosoma japonicum]|nr:hypothetical protein KSF78_0008425 [Schistosoma japonicum]
MTCNEPKNINADINVVRTPVTSFLVPFLVEMSNSYLIDNSVTEWIENKLYVYQLKQTKSVDLSTLLSYSLIVLCSTIEVFNKPWLTTNRQQLIRTKVKASK